MKSIMIICDGMADEPVPSLGWRTPLEYAHTPAMDRLAAIGCSGLVRTIPEGVTASSEVALPLLMGIELKGKVSRAPFEALVLNRQPDPATVYMRCNLLQADRGGIITDTAPMLTDQYTMSEVAVRLKQTAQAHGLDFISDTEGLSGPMLLAIPSGVPEMQCPHPWQLAGAHISTIMPTGYTPTGEQCAARVRQWIADAMRQIADMPANALCVWSPGVLPQLENRVCGDVIAGVPLPLGLALFAGMRAHMPAGATGRCDTDYTAKARKALQLLDSTDAQVIIHIEACDEAAHRRSVKAKVEAIEHIDRMVIEPLLERVTDLNDTIMAVMPDHQTSVTTGQHGDRAVPVALYHPEMAPDKVCRLSEQAALQGSLAILTPHRLRELMMTGR